MKHIIKKIKSSHLDFKKIILTILAFNISLFITSPVFADDLPEIDSGSSSVLIPDEAIDDIATTIILIGSEDEQDKGYSKIGNSTLKDEIVSEIKASTATEYTTTDIYNFIYSAMRGQSTSSTYSLPFIARLLNTIRDEVHGNSTFAANSVTLYDYIAELTLGNDDWHYAMGPMQHMASELDWNLVDGSNLGSDQYSVKDLLGFIYVDCDDIVDNLSSIMGQLTSMEYHNMTRNTAVINSIDSNTNTIYNTLNTTNNTLGNINNNISSVDQNIGGLRDNINDIGWIYSGDTLGAYYYANNTLDISNPIDLSVSGNYTDVPYFSYQTKTPLTDKVIYKAELPIYRNSLNYIDTLPDEVKFYYYYNNTLYTIYDIDYIVLNGRNKAEIYFIMSKGYGNNINLIIKPIYTSGTYSHTSGIIGQLSYIESSKQDYWTMYDIIKKQKNYNNLEKLTNVYASDDMIAQKEAQQPVETQVLEDFTGSGSESMTLGDVVDVKSVSTSVKSALNAGGSASNALNILNSNNNMWQWFTNTTKTNINGNNNRKTAIDNNSEYISIYELNLEQYYRGLGDGKSN